MAVELASAFVSIIPTTKGIQGNLEKELAPLAGAASKAGAESGKALGSSFSGASGGFKSSLENSAKDVGDFKGKANSALDSVSANAGLFAVAGAAAFGMFAIKAVGAFTDTAKAAIDLGASTGLAVEDASRWIGVGDDFKVGADQLQSGIGKIAKSLDDPKWEKYGVATHDAAGQARGANAVLEDSFVMLSKITNKTEQARVGNALFGKGYASLSPLIGHTKDEYDKMLGSVEKGQVITQGEADKAEKWRLAEDQLKDAIHEVTLQIGQEVAGLAPLLVLLAKFVGLVGDAFGPGGLAGGGKFTEITDALHGMDGEIDKSGHDFDYWYSQIAKGKLGLDEAKAAIHGAAMSTDELKVSQRDQAAQSAETDRENRKLPVAWEQTRDAEAEASAAALLYKANAENTKRAVVQNLAEISTAWDVLTGNVDADKAWLTLQGTFDTVKQKAVEAFTAAAEHTDDAEAKMRDYRMAIDDTALGVRSYGADVLGVPKNWATIFKSELDRGSWDLVENQLAILTRNRTMSLSIVAKGGSGVFTVVGVGATGGWRQGPTIVGEEGPELVDFKRPTYISTAAETKSLLASNTAMMQSASSGPVPPITVNNNGRDIGIGDLNQVLAMARLRS